MGNKLISVNSNLIFPSPKFSTFRSFLNFDNIISRLDIIKAGWNNIVKTISSIVQQIPSEVTNERVSRVHAKKVEGGWKAGGVANAV